VDVVRKEATVSEAMWVWDYELKTLGSWPSTGYNGHNTPVEVVTQMDVKTLRDERDRLKRALEEIAMGTAVWERDEMIDCATAALTPAGGVQQHPAFDEYGEHRQPTGLGDL
jgi:hypothetical protein